MPDRISKMEDKEKSESNEWEFISLTASAYSAAPGPHKPHGPDQSKLDTSSHTTKQYSYSESSSPSSLFMSKHFLLPQEKGLDASSCYEMNASSAKELDVSSGFGLDVSSAVCEGKGGGFSSGESKETDELAKSLSLSMEEERESEGVERENALMGGERGNEGVERENALMGEERESEGVERESDGWLKKQIVSFYKGAREGKSVFWTLFLSATLIGVAIMGQRWRREKLNLHQMKLHFHINNERFSCMVGPFNQFKQISVGTNQNYPSVPVYGASLV